MGEESILRMGEMRALNREPRNPEHMKSSLRNKLWRRWKKESSRYMTTEFGQRSCTEERTTPARNKAFSVQPGLPVMQGTN